MGHRPADDGVRRGKALTKKLAIFTTPPFAAALALLLVNDLYLKAQLGNWLTGKLSDFAGLAVVSLATLSFFPNRAKAASAVIGAAFVYWKSPQSQPLIDFVNAQSGIGFARVVDYSDLLALLVLPVSARWFRGYRDDAQAATRARKVALLPMLAITLLAVTGTSAPQPYWQAIAAPRTSPDPVPTATPHQIIVDGLEGLGFDCDVLELCVRDDLRAKVCSDDDRVWAVIEGPLNRGPIGHTGKRKAATVDTVAEELRAALAPQLEVLAYGMPTQMSMDGATASAVNACRRRER